ncbi:hypothetical protein TNCV_177181 [Trichonephila clavipes]|nr:hypothetical protein TNCV_177181 [Trichonephila clavipes]
MMQPVLVDMSDVSNMQYKAELAELQNDDSVKTLFSIKSAMAWLSEETEIKYPNSTKCAQESYYYRFHLHFWLNVDLVL